MFGYKWKGLTLFPADAQYKALEGEHTPQQQIQRVNSTRRTNLKGVKIGSNASKTRKLCVIGSPEAPCPICHIRVPDVSHDPSCHTHTHARTHSHTYKHTTRTRTHTQVCTHIHYTGPTVTYIGIVTQRAWCIRACDLSDTVSIYIRYVTQRAGCITGL